MNFFLSENFLLKLEKGKWTIFERFKSNTEILSTDNFLCQICADVCQKTATSCPIRQMQLTTANAE